VLLDIPKLTLRCRSSTPYKENMHSAEIQYTLRLHCGFASSRLNVYVATELIAIQQKVFAHFRSGAQLAIGPHRLDLYFPTLGRIGHVAYQLQDGKHSCRVSLQGAGRAAMRGFPECDEHGHGHCNATKEAARRHLIEI